MRKKNLFRRAVCFCLVAGFGVGWAAPVEAGMGMAVYPSRFRLKKAAGEAASGTIRVDNGGTYAIRISSETTDMVNRKNDAGTLVRDEAPIGTTAYSCAKWIRLTQGEGAVIPPGESTSVEFVVSPPAEAREGGYAAYLFLHGSPAEAPKVEPSDVPKVRLVTVPRMGISVIYEVEGTIRRAGDLTRLEFDPPSAGKPLALKYEFRNVGNAEVVLAGDFHILDQQGLLAGKGNLRSMKTFPGEQGTEETVWRDPLKPGQYSLLVAFELGPDGEEAIVKEFEFTVPKN